MLHLYAIVVFHLLSGQWRAYVVADIVVDLDHSSTPPRLGIISMHHAVTYSQRNKVCYISLPFTLLLLFLL